MGRWAGLQGVSKLMRWWAGIWGVGGAYGCGGGLGRGAGLQVSSVNVAVGGA